MSNRLYVGLLVGITLVHLGLAAVLPPAEDELYYWCWAQQLQPSYFDHPPICAYMIRLTCSLFGDSVFALRLGAVITSTIALIAVGWLTRRRLLAWLVATPVFLLAAVLLTPDAPLVMFWAIYAVWLTRMLEAGVAAERNWRGWTIGGVILGLGLLSKYTMALAVPCAALAFWLGRRQGWWLGFTAHVAIGAVFALPILAYNLALDFAPLRFQAAHATAAGGKGWLGAAELIGVQTLFVGTLPFLLLPWALWRAPDLWQTPRLRAAWCLSIVPLLFFLSKSVSGRVEANWPLIAFIAFWPLALAWYDSLRSPMWRRWAMPAAFAAPLLTNLALLVQLVSPMLTAPREDRLTRLKAQLAMTAEVAKVAKARPETIIFTPTYQWTAYLRYHGVRAEQLPHHGRGSHFTMRPVEPLLQEELLFFGNEFLPTELSRHFAPVQVIGIFPLIVRGEVITRYGLFRYHRLPQAYNQERSQALGEP